MYIALFALTSTLQKYIQVNCLRFASCEMGLGAMLQVQDSTLVDQAFRKILNEF